MPTRFPSLLAVASILIAAAASPAQQSTPREMNAAFGFNMRLPEDWKIIAPSAPAPSQQANEEKKTAAPEEKRGIACLEVPITALHGDPPTTVVIDVLPFDCYGTKMTEPDLEAFGAGAAEGLKDTLDITTPIATRYKLAGHEMWIERASATIKGKAAPPFTLELVCTLLSKAAVCWVARTADAEGLRTFELLPVTLDGAFAQQLVPKDVFVNNR